MVDIDDESNCGVAGKAEHNSMPAVSQAAYDG
jgi:hypothetical protein